MIVGLMPARCEAWVMPYSARAALQWVDHLVLLDHCSTDATSLVMLEIKRDHPGRVSILRDGDPVWREAEIRQRMLDEARRLGATHIAIVDADEVLSANVAATARTMTAELRSGEPLLAPMHNLWRGLDAFRSDSSRHGKQWTVLAFRDVPGAPWARHEALHTRTPLWIDRARGQHLVEKRDDGGVMHLQRVVWRRAQARQDLYRMQEVTRWPDKNRAAVDAMYAASLDEVGATLLPVPPAWWWADGIDRSLIDLDAEPWEVAECQRMLAAHGREAFAGLSLSC